CRNCTVRDTIFTETYRAVDLEGSHGNLIEGNLISWNRDYAIYSESSSDNRIIRNRMYGAEGGGTIDLWNSHNNTIAENVLDGYDPFGAQSLCFHTGSSGNIVYLNDFLNSNSPTLFSEAGSNIWNATTPVTYTWNNRTLTGYPGNYWQVPDGSGYSGSDGDGDGLGDTPYTLRKSTESDCHPLMAPMAGYLPEEETAPTWIVVSPATPTIVAGETRPFLARYSDQHGVRLYDLPVVWSCDNPAVGTIDDDGLFTAAGPGTATVTAAVGSLAAQAYVTVVEQTPAEGNVTIVVDQSGSGDYTTIGAAVAAAGAGDRIVVHSGTYTETVQVTTPVSITGASGAKSTIVKAPDTGSPCVIVLSGGVSMTGFTFSGGKQAPAVLVRGVSGGRIADVVTQEGYEGIRLDDCSGIRIENLKVPGLVDDVRETHLGVVLVNGSSGNRIEGSTMRTKEYAVWIEDGTGNSVTGNMLYGRARGGSVALFRSDANTVTGNDLDCPNMGLHGVFLWQSANNRIWFNNFLEGHIHTFSTESRNSWVSETPVSYSFDGKEYTGQLGNYWEVVAGYPDNGYAGSDEDGDGIGDTAYPVPHCDSGDVDARPLVQQTGGYTPAPPAADFTANVTSGDAPLAVAFTDASIGAASWSWEFGDGATSTGQNPVHTYGKAGNYTAILTVSSEYGNASAQAEIVVTKQEPTVFNTSVVVYADEPIVVDNASYGGNTFFSILAAAGYTYTYADNDSGYSDRKPLLTLTIENVTYPTRDFGADYLWKFYETIGTGNDNKYKKALNGYIDSSGTYYIWFGDTSQFSGQDLPTVENSIYVVALTVDLRTRPGSAPVADFTANVTSGDAPLAVAFTDLSTNTPTSWAWTFGDGASSA
ncbi:MAG: NosD domain-containing protein, partial [Methanoculleus horonobensis]|nr:NosD domain-containing protein [Methanoculleus horonobensis]